MMIMLLFLFLKTSSLYAGTFEPIDNPDPVKTEETETKAKPDAASSSEKVERDVASRRRNFDRDLPPEKGPSLSNQDGGFIVIKYSKATRSYRLSLDADTTAGPLDVSPEELCAKVGAVGPLDELLKQPLKILNLPEPYFVDKDKELDLLTDEQLAARRVQGKTQ